MTDAKLPRDTYKEPAEMTFALQSSSTILVTS